MISRYVECALQQAKYLLLEDGSFCARVPGLRGIIATGRSLEECREELVETIEEWILVRVARGLSVPPMGSQKIAVRKAS